jgi:isocitrate dehydrogenase
MLLNRKSPSRKVNELDNRGSHFYLALYWAQAVAAQTSDPDLAARFRPVAEALVANEAKIVEELNGAQGRAQDLGGYYEPDPERASQAMRPSPTLNEIIESV